MNEEQCPGIFRAYTVGQDHSDSNKINPTGYMLASSGFAVTRSRYYLNNLFLKSSTSTGYFSNSIGASATNSRFFPDIDMDYRPLVTNEPVEFEK